MYPGVLQLFAEIDVGEEAADQSVRLQLWTANGLLEVDQPREMQLGELLDWAADTFALRPEDQQLR